MSADPASTAPRPGDAWQEARALVWVEGPDAEGFLHGLLSQDIAGIAAGDARPALLLDAKGHIVADPVVHRDGPGAFTLVAEPHLGGALADALQRYHFSEDLEVLGPERADALVVAAAERPDPPGADLVVPGPVPGTWTAIGPDPAAMAAAVGASIGDRAELEAARIAAGVPRVGVDTGDRTLVQEAGLEQVAVSFEKGCYLGQETVARAQFRGRVKRVLRVLEGHGAPPAAPAAVARDGRAAGTLTSVVARRDGWTGLAILRRDAEPGSEVAVGDAAAAATVRAAPSRGPAPD